MLDPSDMIERFHLLAAESSDYADGGEKVFAPLDPQWFPSQIFWTLVSFFILYLLLSRLFLPRVGETIEERGSRIADDLDSASRMQREAEEAEKAFKASLADARAKAMNVAETTKASVDAEVKAELDAADAEADKAMDVAETRIRDLRKTAMANIETVATEAAQAAVEALTGKTITLAEAKKTLSAKVLN